MPGNFCRAEVELWRDNVQAEGMTEASGLCFSSSKKFMYIVNDSPEGEPYIFVFEKATMKRCVIQITGVRDTGFNSRRGSGYGDWEAVEMANDSDKWYIVVADIGHNKVRNKGGRIRNAHQQTRLIFVEEPADEYLSRAVRSSKVLHIQGTEYPIQYSADNRFFDAEAMTIIGDSALIITKNTRRNKRSYVYQACVSAMRKDKTTTFTCVGQLSIQYSEVTDAFCTSKALGVRTYNSINFYALEDLVPGKSTRPRGYQNLQELRSQGLQEAAAYDPTTNKICLLGEGSKKIYSIEFNAAAATRKWTELEPKRRASVASFYPPRSSHGSSEDHPVVEFIKKIF